MLDDKNLLKKEIRCVGQAIRMHVLGTQQLGDEWNEELTLRGRLESSKLSLFDVGWQLRDVQWRGGLKTVTFYKSSGNFKCSHNDISIYFQKEWWMKMKIRTWKKQESEKFHQLAFGRTFKIGTSNFFRI